MSELSRRELLKAGGALALSAALPWGSRAASANQAPAATTTAADPYADGVLVDGEPAKLKPGAFTIAVLPDTQKYSDKFPDTFAAQTRWIVEQQAARKIACALHLGDITDHNDPREWENAQRALGTLDGKVPYFFVNGNHDYSAGGKCTDRTTLLNEYFPVSRFQSTPTFGGCYDKEPKQMENSFHLFSAGGRNFLVLALEFGPRRDVVRWANEVAAAHRDRAAILITHAYMYYDDSRYDWKKLGTDQTWNPHSYGVAKNTQDDVNDGQELWDNLVSKHENFILTLNGHVLRDGLGKLSSATPGGRDVHQMLVNFQMRPAGGDGWLRLMEFQPDGRTVEICDYSPTRQQRNESPQNKFTLQLADVKAG